MKVSFCLQIGRKRKLFIFPFFFNVFLFSLEHNLIVEKDVVLAEITIEKFEEIIGGSIEEIAKRNEQSHENKMMKLENPLKNESKSLNLNDFLFIKKLGDLTSL